MEPDINKTLTQKIRTLETEPISWNKTAVWSRIHEEVAITPKRYWKYYAVAAAVAFFLFFNVYTLQQDRTAPVTSIITDNVPVEGVVVDTDQVVSDLNIDKKKFTKQSKPGAGNIESKKQFAVITLDQTNQQQLKEADALTTEVLLHSEKTAVSFIDTAEEKRIVPIVGVISLSNQNYAETKVKRKKLFHKLEASKTEFDDHFKNTIITARIK